MLSRPYQSANCTQSSKFPASKSIGPTGHPEVRENEGDLYRYSVSFGQVDDVTDAIWVMGGGPIVSQHLDG